MHYLVVGLNHKTAPVSVREKLALKPETVPAALKTLTQGDGSGEALLLSTCNRVEAYFAMEEAKAAKEKAIRFFSSLAPKEDILSHLYFSEDADCIRHLFRVTSGLDSLVIGEPQITGQVREAYRLAREEKAAGSGLMRLFDRAFFVGKRIRTETQIGRGAVSVGAAAVFLARQIFGELKGKNVVLLGAGKISELVLDYLAEEGINRFALINRDQEKARALLGNKNGDVHSFDRMDEALLGADLVIASTSASEPLIRADKAKKLMEERKNRPVFFIDLGVPRNIEGEVNAVENVYLYNIDDLKGVVEAHRGERAGESGLAEEIAEKEASLFAGSMLGGEPALAMLGRKFEQIRLRELEKTLPRLSSLSEEDKRAIDKCTVAIVRKILFDPAMSMKGAGKEGGGLHEVLKKIFRLEEE